MSLSWFIARRYLTARRRQAFISLISGVSMAGVGVGVMALIIALALMTGAQGELRDRIVGTDAHVYVYKLDGVFEDIDKERERLAIPGVTGVAPAIMDSGLLTANGLPQFVSFKGIDPLREPDVTEIGGAIKAGSLIALVNRPPDAKDGVILGADLAHNLGVEVGEVVWAVTAELTNTGFGMMPRQRPLEVVGLFRYGYNQYDTQQGLISMKTAQELFRKDGPDLLQLKLAHVDEAPAVRDALRRRLGTSYMVKDWTELNQELYSALWLEKVAISLTIGLIVMVAGLNIVASLVLLVMEKTRDIAILRTMGAKAATIRRIFILQGLTIGLVGTGSGTILGLLVSYFADKYKLIPMPGSVYQITHLPFRIQPLDVTIVVIAAMAVCLAATIYPSRQAARIDPAEALRNQ